MSEANDSYKVGYGHPPLHSRFKKGVCPNPSGRPKKTAAPSSEYDRELQRHHRVTIDGKVEKLTSTRIIFKQLIKRAMSGDLSAIKIILPAIDALEMRRLNAEPRPEPEKATSGRPDYSHLSTDEIRARLEDKLKR